MTTSDQHSNVLVRMENTLKSSLQHQALAHGRTLTKEINIRLLASLAPTAPGIAPRAPAPSAPPPNDNGPAPVLTDHDRAMLDVFRSLPPEKQLALLSLFK